MSIDLQKRRVQKMSLKQDHVLLTLNGILPCGTSCIHLIQFVGIKREFDGWCCKLPLPYCGAIGSLKDSRVPLGSPI